MYKINMKPLRLGLMLAASLLLFQGCDDDDDFTPVESPVTSNAENVMKDIWATSPISDDMSARTTLYETVQGYADNTPANMFLKYLETDDKTAAALEKYEDAYICYKKAFDKVLEEVKSTTVDDGTAAIWMLYNMGYVIKTPTVTFSVDIYHRHAAELEPYLDFACFTHNHSDHYTTSLMEAMYDTGKPVISNFYEPVAGYEYCSITAKDYTVDGIKIHSFITDHNNATLQNFVTVFQFDCGQDTGNLNIVHTGDTNYKPEQFDIEGNPDIFIPRYAVDDLTENNIIGAVTQPKYVLLSHILELGHDGVANSRWSLAMGLARAAAINCDKTYMPFWGDKMTWDGNVLK